jgi:hypothetical protein
MCALFVHDRFYTLLCSISSVEAVGPRGVIIKLLYERYVNYTVYAFVDIWGITICPRNDHLYSLLFNLISLIHRTPEYVNLGALQKELGERGLFCTLGCLDVLRKWRQTTV